MQILPFKCLVNGGIDADHRRAVSSAIIDCLARHVPHVRASVAAFWCEPVVFARARLSELNAAWPRRAQGWGRWPTVAGAGHWVQYEAAAAFDAALSACLRADLP